MLLVLWQLQLVIQKLLENLQSKKDSAQDIQEAKTWTAEAPKPFFDVNWYFYKLVKT